MSKIFDVEKVERESGLSRNRISDIEKSVKKEFSNDNLMYELHLIRAISYYKSLSNRK